jgi:hypothetical protein
VFVNDVQWSDQIPMVYIAHTGDKVRPKKKQKNYYMYIILQGGELTCFHFFKSSC